MIYFAKKNREIFSNINLIKYFSCLCEKYACKSVFVIDNWDFNFNRIKILVPFHLVNNTIFLHFILCVLNEPKLWTRSCLSSSWYNSYLYRLVGSIFMYAQNTVQFFCEHSLSFSYIPYTRSPHFHTYTYSSYYRFVVGWLATLIWHWIWHQNHNKNKAGVQKIYNCIFSNSFPSLSF